MNTNIYRMEITSSATKMSQPEAVEPPFNFLGLPAELRNMVYEEVVLMKPHGASSLKIICSGLRLGRLSRSKEHCHPLLLVSRQIKDEYLYIEHKLAIRSCRIDHNHFTEWGIGRLASHMQTIRL